MSERLDPPKETAGDKIHALTKGGIGAVPVVGSVGAELFNMVVTPPLSKRLEAWRENVGQRILRLEEAGFVTVEGLQDDDEFISAVSKASIYVASTNDAAKREALLNAVTNTALRIEPDAALQQMFLRFIDEFTGWHIRVLRLFQNAYGWFAENNKNPPQYVIAGSIPQMICAAYPDLLEERELLDLIHRDLTATGLISNFTFRTNMSGQGVYEKRTTAFGDRFLRLISETKVDKPAT